MYYLLAALCGALVAMAAAVAGGMIAVKKRTAETEAKLTEQELREREIIEERERQWNELMNYRGQKHEN